MAGTLVTGLRTGRVGTEEMIPGCLMFILGWGQVLVLRELSDRGDISRHGEGGGRKRWAAKCFNSCSAHPQNDSEGKKIVLFICLFLPYILPATFINICHFPGGLDMSSNSFS